MVYWDNTGDKNVLTDIQKFVNQLDYMLLIRYDWAGMAGVYFPKKINISIGILLKVHRRK